MYTDTYNVNGACGFISKGMILEVLGSMIRVYGYGLRPIKTYSKIDLRKWKEIRTQQDFTKEELQSPYVKHFLEYIPKTHF